MHFHVLVGTTSGNTEYLAEVLARELHNEGHSTSFHDQPVFKEVPMENSAWLVCIATHGAGEYADSIFPLMAALSEEKPDLSTVRFALIGVGDSSYDTFNQAGQDAYQLLTLLKAAPFVEPLTIDMFNEVDPEGLALNWLTTWENQRQ